MRLVGLIWKSLSNIYDAQVPKDVIGLASED